MFIRLFLPKYIARQYPYSLADFLNRPPHCWSADLGRNAPREHKNDGFVAIRRCTQKRIS